jgi:hypothetical protein
MKLFDGGSFGNNMKAKIRISRNFVLLLYGSLTQAHMSIDRMGNVEWGEFRVYLKDRNNPDEVLEEGIQKGYFIGMPTDKIPSELISFFDVRRNESAIGWESITDLFPHRRWYLSQLWEVYSNEPHISMSDIRLIYYILYQFRQMLDMESQPPIYVFSSLRSPMAYICHDILKPVMSSKQISRLDAVEYFAKSKYYDSQPLRDILDTLYI